MQRFNETETERRKEKLMVKHYSYNVDGIQMTLQCNALSHKNEKEFAKFACALHQQSQDAFPKNAITVRWEASKPVIIKILERGNRGCTHE